MEYLKCSDSLKFLNYVVLCLGAFTYCYMACNGVLTPPLSKSNPPVLKLHLPPLRLKMVASAFFRHGYFQQAHVHISEAIITD